jgi:GWxTD domain-containing protein
MKSLKIIFAILLFGIGANLSAQENADLKFEFDYARFKYDSAKTYLEIYYSIGQSNLTKFTKEGEEYNSVMLDVKIDKQDTSSEVIERKYKVNNKVKDTLKNQSLLGLIAYVLDTGEYDLTITASDAKDTTFSKTFLEEVKIKDHSKKNARISDIQLASRIITNSINENSIFYKNTMEVVPHPVGVYGQNYPMLFYYAELYNLDSAKTDSNLVLLKEIYNNYGKKVYDKKKKVSLNNNSIVDVGAVNITDYPTGSYNLILKLFDKNSPTLYLSSKKFFVFNPNVEDTMQTAIKNNPMLSTEFGAMSEEEVERMFDVSKYIATDDEIDQYKGLDSLNAKRKFLYNFWEKRDQKPRTPVNEYKEEYLSRVEHVNQKYGTLQKKGYETDRGRVYLVYGEPDEVDMHPNDPNTKPYEVWYYHQIEGGVMFVFADLTGISDYELLHSTKRGEIRDDYWQRRIMQN